MGRSHAHTHTDTHTRTHRQTHKEQRIYGGARMKEEGRKEGGQTAHPHTPTPTYIQVSVCVCVGVCVSRGSCTPAACVNVYL